jgi:hypothetical protein
MAEFDAPEKLLAAAHRAREAGWRRLDAYAPYPLEGLAEAVGQHGSRLPWIVLGGGLAGCAAGFALQVWVSAVAYPMNVGGRPLLSWPSFIPVTFEMTVLVAAFSAVLGMLALAGLPMPYHPVFNVDRFARASRDRYFLVLEAADPSFEPAAARRFLSGLDASGVFDVPH